jgi:hypothetical protein
MKPYFKWILKALAIDKADHVIEAKHAVNTNAYELYVDDKLKFNDTTFDLKEVKEKIEFLRQFYTITEVVEPELDEEGVVIQKRHRRTKLEMQTFKRQKEMDTLKHEYKTEQTRKNITRVPNSSTNSTENTVAGKKRGRKRKEATSEKIQIPRPTTEKKRRGRPPKIKRQVQLKKRGRPRGSKNKPRSHKQGKKL